MRQLATSPPPAPAIFCDLQPYSALRLRPLNSEIPALLIISRRPPAAPVPLVQVTVTEVFRQGILCRRCVPHHAAGPGTQRLDHSSTSIECGRNRPCCSPSAY